MDLVQGTVLNEKYRLVAPIGEGAMGQVWRAEHEALGEPVAIKFLHRRKAESDALLRRFSREAKLAAAVRHRCVVSVIDYGATEDRIPYIVMEYLTGKTLGQRLADGERFTLRQVLRVGALSLRGLAAIHQAGIIHRDLKPDNVFLVDDPDGFYPKVLDFSVSRSVHVGKVTKLTTDGELVGTLQYMSPEQAYARAHIDERTDLYSMGVILYELLADQLPFESHNQTELLLSIVNDEPVPLSSIRPEAGEDVSAIVAKALQKEPDHRYASAREMASALSQAAYNLSLNLSSWAPQNGDAWQTSTRSAKPKPAESGSDIARALTVVEPRRRASSWKAVVALGFAFATGMLGVELVRGLAAPTPAPSQVHSPPQDPRLQQAEADDPPLALAERNPESSLPTGEATPEEPRVAVRSTVPDLAPEAPATRHSNAAPRERDDRRSATRAAVPVPASEASRVSRSSEPPPTDDAPEPVSPVAVAPPSSSDETIAGGDDSADGDERVAPSPQGVIRDLDF